MKPVWTLSLFRQLTQYDDKQRQAITSFLDNLQQYKLPQYRAFQFGYAGQFQLVSGRAVVVFDSQCYALVAPECTQMMAGNPVCYVPLVDGGKVLLARHQAVVYLGYLFNSELGQWTGLFLRAEPDDLSTF